MRDWSTRLPHVSIIIVNYNGRHYLTHCLQSLRGLSYPGHLYDTIIVDNASTDDSVEFVKTTFPRLKLCY